MPEQLDTAIVAVCINIGRNPFHLVGYDPES